VALEALLEDVYTEHALIARLVVVLLLGAAHLVAVALEVRLPLGQRRRLLVVPRPDVAPQVECESKF
jgi:hypothetical protein